MAENEYEPIDVRQLGRAGAGAQWAHDKKIIKALRARIAAFKDASRLVLDSYARDETGMYFDADAQALAELVNADE